MNPAVGRQSGLGGKRERAELVVSKFTIGSAPLVREDLMPLCGAEYSGFLLARSGDLRKMSAPSRSANDRKTDAHSGFLCR